MEEVIERVRMNIIYPFKNPEVFRRFNRKPGGGILLYGPPGCGKTHLARATAGECGARFISIAITDVLSKWIGESERHLHDLFETARRQAPAVIFIDEIDAIGMARADAGSYQAPIVNVLLTEMDGIQAGNESLMVLGRHERALAGGQRAAAAGALRPRALRAAARPARRGRRSWRCTCAGCRRPGAGPGEAGAGCERFSGADLRAVVERASEKAIYQEMRTGPPDRADAGDARRRRSRRRNRPPPSGWKRRAATPPTRTRRACTTIWWRTSRSEAGGRMGRRATNQKVRQRQGVPVAGHRAMLQGCISFRLTAEKKFFRTNGHSRW